MFTRSSSKPSTLGILGDAKRVPVGTRNGVKTAISSLLPCFLHIQTAHQRRPSLHVAPSTRVEDWPPSPKCDATRSQCRQISSLDEHFCRDLKLVSSGKDMQMQPSTSHCRPGCRSRYFVPPQLPAMSKWHIGFSEEPASNNLSPASSFACPVTMIRS